MDITPQTRLRELLDTYPDMLEFLASYRPAYVKLRNPVLRSTVGAVATLTAIAEMGGVPVDRLVADVRTEASRLSATEGSVEVGEERRADTLKGLIRELHDGASVDAVKPRFDALAGEIGPDGIASLEQELISEGMAVEEIQRLCDVHVSVFKESLERQADAEETSWPAGHPLDTFERENAHIGELTQRLSCAVDSLPGDHVAMRAVTSDLEELSQVDKHYVRKEHQLFPVLERHGISGPTKVMWAIHDDIRDMLKDVLVHARAGDGAEVKASMTMLLKMIDDMVYKERRILFPLAAETLTDDEWREVASGEAEIGFAWVQPSATWSAAEAPVRSGRGGDISLTTGLLSNEQLDLMLRSVPFDLTFVDEDDRVRFYSEGKRVFPRSPAVIGRRVVDCHPPKSVDVVERIVASFKDGSQDVAEFWIELEGRFIHIRYFALRDDEGVYRGTLEVAEDATHVRSLEGQRRLLDW